VPSITIGIFGYIAIVKNFGYSGLAGAFAIGIIMLPVIIRAGETAIRGVPSHLGEAALALGARRATIARRVVVPAALPGIITGVLLAVARGLGETAPLLLTIFGNQFMQWNPTKPMNALPLTIFNNSSQPYPDLVQIAWGAALLLLVIVLVLSVGSRVLAWRLQKERR
jgi:phosphate transport system permease protein